MLFLLGGLWELARFTAIYLINESSFRDIENAALSVLWIAAPALLLAALFFAAAYYPSRFASYLPLIRLGVAVSVLTDALMVISGSYDATPAAIFRAFGAGRTLFLMAFLVLVIDLIILALLLSTRGSRSRDTSGRSAPGQSPGQAPGQPTGQSQTDDGDLPKFDPTEVDGK